MNNNFNEENDMNMAEELYENIPSIDDQFDPLTENDIEEFVPTYEDVPPVEPLKEETEEINPEDVFMQPDVFKEEENTFEPNEDTQTYDDVEPEMTYEETTPVENEEPLMDNNSVVTPVYDEEYTEPEISSEPVEENIQEEQPLENTQSYEENVESEIPVYGDQTYVVPEITEEPVMENEETTPVENTQSYEQISTETPVYEPTPADQTTTPVEPVLETPVYTEPEVPTYEEKKEEPTVQTMEQPKQYVPKNTANLQKEINENIKQNGSLKFVIIIGILIFAAIMIMPYIKI